MRKLKNLFVLIGVGLVTAAVVREMKKPPEERQWHGRVAGFVPYDFRIPSLEMFKDTYWNPEEPRIFTDRVLGVGWGVNLGRLLKLARGCCQGCAPD